MRGVLLEEDDVAGERGSPVDPFEEIVAREGVLRDAPLDAAHEGPDVVDDHAVFVAARDLMVRKPQGSALAGWRVALFAFLYRNSVKIVDRFNLAPDRVIEIARQIEI